MRKAIGYARISMDRTGEGSGVERQHQDIRHLAALRGFTLTDVIIENDTSAAGRRPRPGFERMLESIEAGTADVVIAWALDRLTRNRHDTVKMIETCQRRGALIALVRGSDMDMGTPSGRLTADLLAAVARAEIETKSDRQIRATQQAVEAGKWRGGRRPFGYEADGRTIRPDEAQAVRDAYSWLLAGTSLAEVARRWNARGFHTPQGARGTGAPVSWTQASLSKTMRNPRYAGLHAYQREITGRAEWDGLVDEDTWRAVQAILSDPGRRPRRGDMKLLTGVARCAVCDLPVWAGGAVRAKEMYRCRSGAHVNRLLAPVDAYVLAVTVERLSRPDAATRIAADLAAGPDRASVADLARQADEARVKLDALATAFADGAITASQLTAGTSRLRATLAEIEASMAVAVGTSAAEVRAVADADDVCAAWDALDQDARRRIIDTIMTIRLHPPGRGRRIFDPDTVEIAWRTL